MLSRNIFGLKVVKKELIKKEQEGHVASSEDFSVLERVNNDFDLLIHENLLILRDRPFT